MPEILSELYARLRGFRNRSLKADLAFGTFLFILFSSGVFFLFTLVEWLFHASVSVRTFLFVVWALLSTVIALLFIVVPFVKMQTHVSRARYFQLAASVGNHFPGIADHLLNILQLTAAENAGYASASLTLAALRQLYHKVRGYNFLEAVSFLRARRMFPFALSSGVGVLLLTLTISPFHQAAGRLLLFYRDFKAPPKYTLKVLPGNIRLTKGSSVKLSALVFGGTPPRLSLLTKDKEQNEFSLQTIERDSTGEYTFALRNLRNDVAYYAELEGIESERYMITVVDRPLAQTLLCRITPPSYAGLPQSEQRDNGNITCLKGSTIEFSLRASKPLSGASIVLNDSQRVRMTVAGENAAVTLRAMFDARYRFEIRDIQDISNDAPVSYSIKPIADADPSIELLSPGQNIALTGEQRVPLSVRLGDDYGFSSLKLHYRLSASRYESPQVKFTELDIPLDKALREQTVNYIWNLSALSLATEDVITYYLEVADNDVVSGPKKARTGECTVRIPSLEELFKEHDRSSESAEKDLKKTLEEAAELKKDMEKLSNELRKDQSTVSWEEKEKAKQMMQRFNKLQENVQQIQKQMKEASETLRENNVLSKETLEKYMELQELMKQMSSEEMRKAMERMQSAMQQLDRKQLQDALQNMKFDEEMFKNSVERTLNLLKRIQIEQKVDELVKRAEETEREQQELAEKAEQAKNDKALQDKLSKEQKLIGEKLKQFEREMKELSDKMKDFQDLPNDEMKDIQKEFDEQQNDELSEQAQSDMQKMDQQEAAEKQQQIAKNMKKMANRMQGLQSSIRKQQQMQVFMDMMRLLNDLIGLSKQEEELKRQSLQNERGMPLQENARKQNEARADLDRLIQQMGKLSQKTFAISPEMGKEIGDARRSMEQAISSLQNRNPGQAAGQQNDAMKSLNQAAAMLKQSMNDMMQQGGQGGGGMMSLMQQLGKLSGQQMSLNNLAQQLMHGNGGKLSQEQMGQLQRLAQQQELIKKSLQQLEKEARSSGQSKRMPANLNQIAKEMEEVVSEMRTQKLDNDLIQKQERILSKLLDAQRSINERDYEKDRESSAGTNVTRQSPANPAPVDGNRNQLQDELLNAQREGYSRDYQGLIRKYFEKLQTQKNN